jgi:hypothetical protein
MDNTGTIISLIGVYLSLISIVGSLFFVQLTAWYRQIMQTKSKWLRYSNNTSATDKHVECYLEALDEAGPQPAIGSGLFLSFLSLMFAFALLANNAYAGDKNITAFLMIPLYIFSSLILIVSLVYLIIGYPIAKRMLQEIKSVLKLV